MPFFVLSKYRACVIGPGLRGSVLSTRYSVLTLRLENFENLEAAGGIEPPKKVLQTFALATWLRRPVSNTAHNRKRAH